MATILIIEDEPELVKVLRSYLEQAGFTVLAARRGDTGLSTWEQRKPDLVVLDLNLPGMDGLDVAREIRRTTNTPIIMLTARVEETDELIGLELGADDYIPKPFSPRVVVAGCGPCSGGADQGTAPQNTTHLRPGNRSGRPYGHSAAGMPLDLTPTEFSLLPTLAGQPGRAFSRLQLLRCQPGRGL